jgi:hydrogenase maturation protein HypF
VALGGGSFQNRILRSKVVELVESEGLDVLTPSAVPANDGGLALGQAAVAARKSSDPPAAC